MPIHGYPGNVITANPVAPTSSVATGVWTTEQQLAAVAAGNWPFTIPTQQIASSLRFNSADSAYLTRTPASTGNRQKFTISLWMKRSTLGGTDVFTGNGGNGFFLNFRADNTFYLYDFGAASGGWQIWSAAVYRDVSAWYHIVIAIDTTQATDTNRAKIYINGVLQDLSTWTVGGGASRYPSLNANLDWNTTASHEIGYAANYGYFNGYLTEFYNVDGQQLAATSFGQYSASTGVWEPIPYTGTYGTNGFYVNFSDNSGTTSTTLGKDYSGNGNNWTPNNFSVTAGAGNDSLVDSPTSYGTDTGVGGTVRGNYCTLNPLDKNSNLTLSNGNLDFVPANTSDLYSGRSTFQIPSTGKWIWQVTNTNSAYMITAGLIDGATPLLAQQTVSCASMTVGSIGTFFSTTQWMNTTTSWSVTNVGNGDTLVIAYDADAGKIWFGRVASGGSTVSWYNTSGTADPSTGTDPRASGITAGKWFAGVGAYYTPSGASINYGQRPFAFTNAPSGFKALCTQNLPTPTIGATSTTQADNYFGVTTWTGNGTYPRNITCNFSPDLVWTKARNQAWTHNVFDSVRGTGNSKYLVVNATNAEGTYGDYANVSAFNADGFQIGSTTLTNVQNDSSGTFVGWLWRGSDSSAVTNTDGTITSTVSANTTSGFSIVTFTSGSPCTVGHGLGVAPSMIIMKSRNNPSGWSVYHASIGNTGALNLQATTSTSTSVDWWSNTSPTSSVFSVGANIINGWTWVAYCFAPVAGYSAFGSYVGNGSADGPFVFTNFRPRYVLVKGSTFASNWNLFDTSRNPYNITTQILRPNLSDAEFDGNATTGGAIDILSNGFKIRKADGDVNSSGQTFIYMAFAENPFKYSLAR